jgi:hypothetical protein
MLSFPRWHWAPIWLPASRRYSPRQAEFIRPRSRAVQRFSVAELLSEAFQLAWTDGGATGLRTRQRHICVLLSASPPLSSGSAAAFGGAFTRGHGSRLLTLRLPFVCRPAVAFLLSPTFWKVFTGPAETSCPPRFECSLCPAFQRLSFG